MMRSLIVCPIWEEEEPLERNLASNNKEMENVESDSVILRLNEI